LGSYEHGSMLNATTLGFDNSNLNGHGEKSKDVNGTTSHMPNTPYCLFHIGYNFESHARHAIESGINTSDRSLPVTLQIDNITTDANNDVRVDTWAQVDCMIYVGIDGSISTST